ncbi:MAG: transcription elongation factor GreA [Dehalococcoidia bacterium]|nr:transcription elongation factor GreA [Dehalococcoidia bacterium]
MTQRKVQYLTQEGYTKLGEELDLLRTVSRREVAEQLKLAADVGGTADNAEYDDAKREQARVEGRVQELEELFQSVQVVKQDQPSTGRVRVGSSVTVRDPKGKTLQFLIVGSAEADPSQQKISNTSPVGMALMGKKTGDEAKAETPTGVVKFKVVKVQ